MSATLPYRLILTTQAGDVLDTFEVVDGHDCSEHGETDDCEIVDVSNRYAVEDLADTIKRAIRRG